MLPALDAILGHKSAHSFATGPVMAEPAKRRMKYRVRSEGPPSPVLPTQELIIQSQRCKEQRRALPFISPLLFTMTPALSSK